MASFHNQHIVANANAGNIHKESEMMEHAIKHLHVGKVLTTGIMIGMGLLLSACGSDDSSSASTNTILSGTAATGAPIVGGDVKLSCLNSLVKIGIPTNANGQWSSSVPNANLPCAVSVSGGTVLGVANTASQFSATTTLTGTQTVNISPLTSLALAAATGVVPSSSWLTGLSNVDLQAITSALSAAITALNNALASYALPANFNPFSSLLTAAAAGQAGNDYDRLLDQFKIALANNGDTLEGLLADAANDPEALLLPSPPPAHAGATSFANFFSTFAGDYTLTVTDVASEGVSSAAATLFPLHSSRVVHLKTNGDVTIDAVGKTITYKAVDYNQDFIGAADSENQLRYRTKDTYQWLELYITYKPSTGELSISPSGFLPNSEGFAVLKGKIFVPPPVAPAETCTTGDDKLVFTDGPADFCGFTRSASATNNVPHYYQFTSTSGVNGVTWVKFNLSADDSTVESAVIENDEYAFGCNAAGTTPCEGITISNNGNYVQFILNDTEMSPTFGSTQSITVGGLLMHPLL